MQEHRYKIFLWKRFFRKPTNEKWDPSWTYRKSVSILFSYLWCWWPRVRHSLEYRIWQTNINQNLRTQPNRNQQSHNHNLISFSLKYFKASDLCAWCFWNAFPSGLRGCLWPSFWFASVWIFLYSTWKIDYSDFFVELASRKQFKDDIQRVVRFEDFVEFHVVWVIQMAHNFNLFDETFLPVFLRISSFFWKGLNCKIQLVF